MTFTARRPAWLDDQTIEQLTRRFAEISDSALSWFGPSRLFAGDTEETLAIENKADAGFDPVTVADRTIEMRFRAAILEAFPDHSIVGEEHERHDGSADAEWIIDPIDGTRAFVSGRPMWGSLVGLSVGGQPVAGWMHLPVLGTTTVGHADGASMSRTVDGRHEVRPIRASSTVDLAEATMACTDPGMFRTEGERAAFRAVRNAVRLTRYDGDCANYGGVAAGFIDLVVEHQLQPYDIVPLVPILEGAGAVITAADGGSPLSGGWVVAAATAELHAAALEEIRRAS